MNRLPHASTVSAHPAAAKWLARECRKGLESIHLTVAHKPGITAGAVLDELLASEAAIAAGRTRPAPRAADQVVRHLGH